MADAEFIARYGLDPETAPLNTAKFWPIRDRCLVLPDVVKKVTDSGIHIPDVVVDKQQMRQLKATLIAVAGDVFEDYGEKWKSPLPKIGDRIWVKVAAGVIHDADDGKQYRIINDADILGICEE